MSFALEWKPPLSKPNITLDGYILISKPANLFRHRLPSHHVATILLLRRRMRLSREVSDDVVRSRGCEVTHHTWLEETLHFVIMDNAVTLEKFDLTHSVVMWRATEYYLDNARTGKWQSWRVFLNSNAVFRLEEHLYGNDESQGQMRTLLDETIYVNDRKHGVERHWFANGQLQRETPYVNGEKHGIEREWLWDGTLKTEYESVAGEYFTQWVSYGPLDAYLHPIPREAFSRGTVDPRPRVRVERELYRGIPLQQLRRLRPKIPWL